MTTRDAPWWRRPGRETWPILWRTHRAEFIASRLLASAVFVIVLMIASEVMHLSIIAGIAIAVLMSGVFQLAHSYILHRRKII